MPNKPYTLAIDARPLARNMGGMTRYLNELLSYIVDSGPFQVVLYIDVPISNAVVEKLSPVKLRTIGNSWFSKFAWYFCVPIWLRRDCPDLYWSPRHHLPVFMPQGMASVVTIHDLVWKACPQTMPKTQWLSERLFMPAAIRKADTLICISKSTQLLLEQYFSNSINASTVITHGVSNTSNEPILTTSKGHYILAVGSIEPRKNYLNLIRAFEKYARDGELGLVIVGKKGWLYDDVQTAYEQSAFKHRIKFAENVTDEQLLDFYNHAAAFISPSLDEGYGLPAQEATFYGVPLLLSDIPVYRELYPYAFAFFDPGSCQDIAQAMKSLEKSKPNYQVNVDSMISWEQCAQNHIDCFLKVLKAKKSGEIVGH